MKVVIVSGRKEVKKDVITVPDDGKLIDLKKAYKPHISIHRKAFKLPTAKDQVKAVYVADGKTLKEQGVVEGTELTYKDLGPQVDYKTVFVVEYAGPIALMLLYALRPTQIYSIQAALTDTQKLWIGLFVAHFVKRELETFFVHKFSQPTMPLFNIFKNSTYYWSFAAFIGYFLCHPQYTAPAHGLGTLAVGGWAASELMNFLVHFQLSRMRKDPNDKSRKAPRGGFFNLCSCPNYFFEVLGWVFFSLGTNIAMSWAFTFAGLVQMTEWALKKHRAYVKAEPDLKRRKAIIPFLI
jgi:very-long-chain enoyl-CoA reductase